MPRKTKSVKEAGLKRSIARRFNDVLKGKTSVVVPSTDKRVERRLKRYMKELEAGKAKGKALTPLDIAMRVHELLDHGTGITKLRKAVKPRSSDYDQTAMAELLKEMHPIYRYRAEAYRFAGVDDTTLLEAGIIDSLPKKRGPKPGAKAKKTRSRSKKK